MQIINKIIVNIDGSSKGNPGPSGVGVIFESETGEKLLEISKFIGNGTNNQAEYEALVEALKMLGTKHLNWTLGSSPKITIKTDSELLYNQVNGTYRVRDRILQKLWSEVTKLKNQLPKLNFVLVPREENRECDCLAKKAVKKSGVHFKKPVIKKVQTLFS